MRREARWPPRTLPRAHCAPKAVSGPGPVPHPATPHRVRTSRCLQGAVPARPATPCGVRTSRRPGGLIRAPRNTRLRPTCARAGVVEREEGGAWASRYTRLGKHERTPGPPRRAPLHLGGCARAGGRGGSASSPTPQRVAVARRAHERVGKEGAPGPRPPRNTPLGAHEQVVRGPSPRCPAPTTGARRAAWWVLCGQAACRRRETSVVTLAGRGRGC